ncbi:MAG: hypothetical protein LBR53_02865 [Deltaproteobacteria bacterium]|nr:hypothetical protein [Deltaproteobacteria bacterium]
MSTRDNYYTQGTKGWTQTGTVLYLGADVIYRLEPQPRAAEAEAGGAGPRGPGGPPEEATRK